MEVNCDETYSHQRKCRLADVILDYLDDDEVSARRFYEELLSEVDELAEYHKNKWLWNSKNSSSDTDLLIPLNLVPEWESYLECCRSLEVEPNPKEGSSDTMNCIRPETVPVANSVIIQWEPVKISQLDTIADANLIG